MNKKYIGVFLILLLPTILAGVQKEKKTYELIYKDVQLLRQQVAQLKGSIEKNAADINSARVQLKELLDLLRHLQTEQASIKEDQKKMPLQYQVLLEKLDQMNQKLAYLSEDLLEIKMASFKPQEKPKEKSESEENQSPPLKEGIEKEKTEEQTEEKPPTPPQARLSPKEVYSMAHTDYRKGNFQLAIAGFTIYTEKFPESPLIDDSIYWTGECFFSQGSFEEAIEQFNELIINYPNGDKIPAAYLKKGICLIELGKKAEALSVLKLLVSKYPLEEETKIAQQKIKELFRNERHQQS
ncbi:MAG: tol-pal system protein YbgF [Candidatus Aminicenantes bacterium]|nr:tol-pal system protein YbgF [Candidatus Aminicenantes bacterium]